MMGRFRVLSQCVPMDEACGVCDVEGGEVEGFGKADREGFQTLAGNYAAGSMSGNSFLFEGTGG